MTTPLTDKVPAPVKRGFQGLPCVRCGTTDRVLLDLEDTSKFECGDCDESFSADDVRKLLNGWATVLAWIDLAPAVPE